MFFVNNVDGKDYAVKFFHNIRPVTGRPTSKCEIHVVPTGTLYTSDVSNVVGEGNVTLDSRDQYSRPAARKKTLEKAVATLPKEVRKFIWDEYFDKHIR